MTIHECKKDWESWKSDGAAVNDKTIEENIRDVRIVAPNVKFPCNKTNATWTSQTTRANGKTIRPGWKTWASWTEVRWVKTSWEELRRGKGHEKKIEESQGELDRDEGRLENLTRSEKSWEELKNRESLPRLL